MKSTLAIAALAILAATTVQAQSVVRSPRAYLDGGIAADLDPNTYASGLDSRPAGALAIGAALPHRWTLRFEATVPSWHEESNTSTCSRCFPQGPVTISQMQQHRISTYAFMTGRDFSLGRRVQFTPLIGATVSDHEDHNEVTFSPAVVAPGPSTNHEPLFIVSWGVELAIAVTERVAIVPGLRMHVVPGYDEALPIVRPGLTIRVGL